MLRLKYERREHLKEVRWPSVASHRRCLCSGVAFGQDLHRSLFASHPPEPMEDDFGSSSAYRTVAAARWSSTWTASFVLRHPAVVVGQAPSLALWRRAPSARLSPSAGGAALYTARARRDINARCVPQASDRSARTCKHVEILLQGDVRHTAWQTPSSLTCLHILTAVLQTAARASSCCTRSQWRSPHCSSTTCPTHHLRSSTTDHPHLAGFLD